MPSIINLGGGTATQNDQLKGEGQKTGSERETLKRKTNTNTKPKKNKKQQQQQQKQQNKTTIHMT